MRPRVALVDSPSECSYEYCDYVYDINYVSYLLVFLTKELRNVEEKDNICNKMRTEISVFC